LIANTGSSALPSRLGAGCTADRTPWVKMIGHAPVLMRQSTSPKGEEGQVCNRRVVVRVGSVLVDTEQ